MADQPPVPDIFPGMNPDLLYEPGSVTFFWNPATNKVDWSNHPDRHADMLNRDGCKLGRSYLRPDQHNFDAVPLLRTKVTYHGVVAGRIGKYEGRPVICIWNQLDEAQTRCVVAALCREFPQLTAGKDQTFIVSNGYRNGADWQPLAKYCES
jgi:hypothetical protein